jgi:PKD repeat protein
MLDNGRLRYGIYQNNQTRTIDSPLGYNDGQWHQVVVTQGSNGQRMYVDGAQVATSNFTTPQNYTGYWRVGSDPTWGGATSNNFAGTIDEVSIYPRVLPLATVGQHWAFGAPNQAPTAVFTSSCNRLACSFDGSGSADANGSIASYAWQFGDGETGTGATPSHTYAAAGTYNAVLTVTDNEGASTTVTHAVTVTIPPNQPPTAAFSPSCTDLQCGFDASGSTDADGSIASYAWQFGDGDTGTGASPSHTYAAGGSYDVVLTVTDNDGRRDGRDAHGHGRAAEPGADGRVRDRLHQPGVLVRRLGGDRRGRHDRVLRVGLRRRPDRHRQDAVAHVHRGRHVRRQADGDGRRRRHRRRHPRGHRGAGERRPGGGVHVELPGARLLVRRLRLVRHRRHVASYAWDFGDGDTGTGASPSHTYAARARTPSR